MKYIIILLCSVTFAHAQIEEDKILHFGAGAAIGAGTSAIVYSATKNKKKAVIYGLLTSTAAGIIKETIDSGEEGNKFDGVDALATSLGGAVGVVTITIVLDGNKKKKRVKNRQP